MKYDDGYPERVKQYLQASGKTLPRAVELKYDGMVLRATTNRTPEENYRLVKIALIALLGFNPFVALRDGDTYFEMQGGKIDFFRTY